MVSAILVFIMVFLLFSAAGVFFPVDPVWYQSLRKPLWTPSGKVIGIIWTVLFCLIALSLAIVQYKVGLLNTSRMFLLIWLLNYVANQAYSFILFRLKNLNLAFYDSAFIAVTALSLIDLTWAYSRLAAILLIPYAIWAGIATFLSWKLVKMNA